MSSKFNTAQFKRTTKKAFRSWTNWAVGFNQNMQIQKKKKNVTNVAPFHQLFYSLAALCTSQSVRHVWLFHCGIASRWALVAACSLRGDNQEAGPMWSPRRITDTFEGFENIFIFYQRPCQRGHQRWTVRRANTVQLLLEWKTKVVLLWYSEDIVIWNLQIRTKTPATDRFPSDHSELLSSWRPVGSAGMVGWALGAWTPPAGEMLLSSWLDQK